MAHTAMISLHGMCKIKNEERKTERERKKEKGKERKKIVREGGRVSFWVSETIVERISYLVSLNKT